MNFADAVKNLYKAKFRTGARNVTDREKEIERSQIRIATNPIVVTYHSDPKIRGQC